MGISQQAKEEFWASTPDPVELPFAEGVRAVFEAGRLTDQSFSTHVQLREPLANQFQRMLDLGIGAPELPWPLTDRTAEDALAWVQSQQDAILARRSDENGPPDPFLQTADELRQGVKERVQEAQARASRAGVGASLAGGAGVGVTDIFNLATLPFGAAKGASLLTSALTEAGLATISQLGVEAASLGAKERAGVDVTLGGVAERVATTAVGAGALVGMFHGIGRVAEMRAKVDGYRRGVAEGTIKPTRELDEAANALQDHIDTVPPLSSPAAEAAHFKATQAAVDVHRAEDPTMRASAVVRMEEAAREAVIREAEAAAKVPEPPHVQVFRQVHDLTPEQLDKAVADARDSERTLLSDVFGDDGAKRYESLQRASDSMDPNRRDSAIAGLDAMERGLSEQQQARLYGTDGAVSIAPDDVKPFRDAAYDIDGATDAELASETGRSMTKLPDEKLNPSAWSEREMVAAFKFRRAMAEAERRGLDMEEFKRSAMKAGASRFSDPNDAEFMLRRFLDPRGGAESTPQAYAQIASPLTDDIAARFDAIEQIDNAIAREAESPTPPVVEVPIDAPLARPAMTAAEAATDAEFRALAEAQPDLRVEVDLGDETLTGSLAEIAARLDAEEAELTGTVDCLLGGVA